MSGFDIGGAQSASGKSNTVKYGMYQATRDLSGRSVSDIRGEFASSWSMPGNTAAYVNNQKVNEDYTLGAGEEVVFIREAGEKG